MSGEVHSGVTLPESMAALDASAEEEARWIARSREREHQRLAALATAWEADAAAAEARREAARSPEALRADLRRRADDVRTREAAYAAAAKGHAEAEAWAVRLTEALAADDTADRVLHHGLANGPGELPADLQAARAARASLGDELNRAGEVLTARGRAMGEAREARDAACRARDLALIPVVSARLIEVAEEAMALEQAHAAKLGELLSAAEVFVADARRQGEGVTAFPLPAEARAALRRDGGRPMPSAATRAAYAAWVAALKGDADAELG